MLRTHVGLNYSFTLNNLHIIDSARVGNETRYINHGTEEGGLANATAKSALRNTVFPVYLTFVAHCHFSDLATLVLGEPRIALYAST